MIAASDAMILCSVYLSVKPTHKMFKSTVVQQKLQLA